MKDISPVYKSRFGFHPCDYTTFLKIKLLHKYYWQAVYDFHRWHRWWRKEPQNRRGPGPKYCETFVEEQMWYKAVCIHGEKGFKVYPRTVVDHGVLEMYQAARLPQAAPVPLWEADVMARIELLYDKIRPQVNN